MKNGKLTSKEISVIKMLLEKHGIYNYEIVPDAPGEKSLLGSNYAHEIESMSGFVVTSQKIYSFWLDWYKGQYTLGEEEGFWEELLLTR